jgi:cytochrome c
MTSMARYRLAWPAWALALLLAGLTLAATLGGSSATAPSEAGAQGGGGRYHVLAYSRTTIADSHTAAIEAGHDALDDLAANQDFDITHSEEASLFTDHSLRRFDVVVFLNSNGEGNLNASQRASFERWTQRGGGAVRIHADANADKAWDWKRDMMGGGLFNNHPPIQQATVEVTDPSHPATDDLPASFTWSDEWYNFDADPREQVHVLLTVDESTYEGGQHGPGHPIAWCSEYDGGRNFYTAIGHAADGATLAWSDDRYLDHVAGALEWAAGQEPGDCGAARTGLPTEASLTKVPIEENVANPMSLDIANDGRVFFTQMGSTMSTSGPALVRMHDPEAGQTYDIATLQVLRRNENGLMGIALDPNFDSNNFVYLYYSVPGPFNEMGTHRLSRFDFDPEVGPAGQLDMSSEVVLLEVPHQRQVCCHASGSVQFGPDGLLYLSTGDDTEHARSQGYSPHDARPCGPGSWNPGDADCQSGQDTWALDARHANDARRSSGNTADLRGKILRIDPIESATPADEPGVGSTYGVPDSNLFTSGEYDHLFPGGVYDPELGRPEIYTMGHRNPFRFGFDPETGWIYAGEVGPDSNQDSLAPPPSTGRGPRGYDEVNQIREAGNFGWPYCIADNKAYRPYIFTGTGNSGAGVPGDNNPSWPGDPPPDPVQDDSIPYFDCEGGPTNHSPLNDGLEVVPPAQEAWIYYPYGASPEFPDIPAAGSRAAIGGPVYRYDAELDSDVKLSEWFDGKLIWGDWTRNVILITDIDEDGGYAGTTELMPSELFRHPHDIELGPDGAIYLIEWGLNFNYGSYDVNPDAGIYRIEQRTGGLPALATATASPGSGRAPLEVRFTGELSDRGADDPPTYEWDFGDGETSTEPNPTHVYEEVGTYEATLTVTDTESVTTDTVTIRVVDPSCTRSDEFDGDQLNGCRWTQIVRENPDGYSVGGGALSIVAGPGDMFGGNTGAENLILQPAASDGEWTVETELSYEATENYHQAGLILYGDDANWAKFGLLWANERVLEYVWQQNGSPRRDTALDVMPVDASFPSTFLMRLESDGTDVTAHYSIDDGETWTQVGRTVPIATIPDPHVGLFAFRATTGSTENVATFEYFRVTPDDVPTTEPELRLRVSPRRDSVKPGALARFAAAVRNVGDGPASNLRVCARAPKSKLRLVGRSCTGKGGLAPGASMSPTFRLRPRRSARGNQVRVTFTATAAGLGVERAQAMVKVKR